MAWSAKYREYRQNRFSERPWFKAKAHGAGWTPATWEGWLATFVYGLLTVSSALFFTESIATRATVPVALGSTVSSDFLIGGFVVWFALLTVGMLWICVKTGEDPKWRWSRGSNVKK